MLIELDAFNEIVKRMLDKEISGKYNELLFNTSGRLINAKKYINIGMIYQ